MEGVREEGKEEEERRRKKRREKSEKSREVPTEFPSRMLMVLCCPFDPLQPVPGL